MHSLLRTKINRCIILCLCLLWGNLLKAERKTLNQLDKDKKKYSFGIGLGPSYHRLSVDRSLSFVQQDRVLSIYPAAIPGFSTQSFSYVKLGKHWNMRTIALIPFFNFSQYNLTMRIRGNEGIEDRFRVIEAFKLGMPFDIIFKSDRIHNFRFYTLGGIYGHYNFFTTRDDTINQDDILVNFNRFDWGVNLGIGFDFYTTYNIISLEVKYNLGLHNLYLKDNASFAANTLERLSTRDIYFYIIIH